MRESFEVGGGSRLSEVLQSMGSGYVVKQPVPLPPLPLPN